MDIRLRAYAPNGAALGILPDPIKLDAGLVSRDLSSLTVRYSRLAAGGALLKRGLEQGLEVALEVNFGQGWVEPKRCRFILLKRKSDRLDDLDVVELTMPGYAWLLRKARALDTTHIIPDGQDGAGSRLFSAATAGGILGALLDENRARGGVPITRTFTDAVDSAGQAWTKATRLLVPLGADLWTVLDSLTAQGMCDWETDGRTLNLYVADSRSVDKSKSVVLRPGRDLVEAPAEETLEEVASVMLIRGEGGRSWTAQNPSAPAPWGRWEGLMSQGGVTDEGTALSLAQADLERASRVRGQYTRTLLLQASRLDVPDTLALPVRDYQPGDWITAPTDRGQERVRVQQITLSRDDNGVVTGSLVLNDRFVDADVKRAQRLAGLVGNASSTGGNGSQPGSQIPPDKETRTPKAPTGLVVLTTAAMSDDGQAFGQISAQWDAVTEATDGTSMEIAGYNLCARVDQPGSPWRILSTVMGDNRADFSPLPTGQRLWVAVAAVSRYGSRTSALSTPVFVEVASDATPPPVPSDPIVTSSLGVIRVEWDGKGQNGVDMPFDFLRVEVENGGKIIGTLVGAGVVVDADVIYDMPSMYRMRSVDRSENKSEWTDWAYGMAQRLVETDIILRELDASQTLIKNASMLVLQSGQLLDERLAWIENNAKGQEHQQVYTRDPVTSDGTGRPTGVTWTKVDGAGKVVGYWRWDGSSWQAMPIAPGMIPKIDVGVGTIGNLDVSRLAASTALLSEAVVSKLWAEVVRAKRITADMLTIGSSGENIVPDPNFQTPASWSLVSGATIESNVSRSAGLGLRLLAANASATSAEPVPVTPGDDYQVGIMAWSPSGVSTSDLALGVQWIDTSGNETFMYYTLSNSIPGGAWTRAYVTASVPQNAVKARARVHLWTSGKSLNVESISMVKMTDATVIKDGAILTRHIVSGSITSEKIAAMAITADKIAANSITADRIKAGAIQAYHLTSDYIEGKSLKGGIIWGSYISTSDPGSQRGIKLSPDGLWAYNQYGATTFNLSATSGDLTAAGTFSTRSPSGYGVSMTTTAYGNQAGLQIVSPYLQLGGALLSKQYNDGAYAPGDLCLHGPEVAINAAGRAELVMQNGGYFRLGRIFGPGGFSGFSYDNGYVKIKNFRTDGSSDIELSCQQHISMWTNAGGITLRPFSDVGLYPGQDLYLKPNRDIYMYPNRSTSSSFYLAVESNLKVGFTGSVRAIKAEIEDMFDSDVDLESVKKLRPRTWLDKGQLADGIVRPGDRVGRIAGFVAEEIEEIGGMEPFLMRRDGKLAAVAYDRIPAALVAWLRELEARVNLLEGK